MQPAVTVHGWMSCTMPISVFLQVCFWTAVTASLVQRALYALAVVGRGHTQAIGAILKTAPRSPVLCSELALVRWTNGLATRIKCCRLDSAKRSCVPKATTVCCVL